MPDGDGTTESYDAISVGQLETIWGEGFLSPGGPAEVARIVAGVTVGGADVLDIGSGTGGAALTLAIEHGARSVTGVDVGAHVVDVANGRATARGKADAVRFVTVEPGPLPLPDGSFDVVFSKDAIIHVEDKASLYGEAHRVLRPGGRLCMSDWLRGEGAALDAGVASFIESSGEAFFMRTLTETAALVAAAGFVDVDVEDRAAWYHDEAVRELAALQGSLEEGFVADLGPEVYEGTVTFWKVLVEATGGGVLRPAHVRATKPG
jgi:phosphoethanolamine N-methyltransferase